MDELKAAGAVLVDPLVIPNLKALLAKRATNPAMSDESLRLYLARNQEAPFKTREDIAKSPDLVKSIPPSKADQWKNPLAKTNMTARGAYLEAHQEHTRTSSKGITVNYIESTGRKTRATKEQF